MIFNKQHGFGLIEVFISFFIVAVTAGSLLSLNKTYLEYIRDGRSREVAIRLAESRLDDLRIFKNMAEYEALADGSETLSIDDVSYDVVWSVVSNGAVKDVYVEVFWIGAGGDSESVSLSSSITPNLSVTRGPFGTGSDVFGTGSGGPKVEFTPGQAPDVVAIDLDDVGSKQETSKPVVTVYTSGNKSVKMKTMTYDAMSSTRNKLIEQEMETVSCNCSMKGLVDYESAPPEYPPKPRLPTQHEIRGNFVYWDVGDIVKKEEGSASSGNPPLCQQCCKDHFDAADVTDEGISLDVFDNWYDAVKWGQEGGKHKHYSRSGSGPFTLTEVEPESGGAYLESCRLVRVDGFFRTVQDWNLVVLNVFNSDLLEVDVNESDSLYKGYISKIVECYAKAQIDNSDMLNVDSGFNTCLSGAPDLSPLYPVAGDGLDKLSVKAIYVDFLSPEYKEYLAGIFDDDAQKSKVLRYIPFNELDVTELADVTVTKGDGNSDSSLQPGDKVTVYMGRSNSGLAGSYPISPIEDEDDGDDITSSNSKVRRTTVDILAP
ncbi:type IV pilus modification PilV family protein [Zobellella denitrificans]